ncbi:MAG: hypothetical protein LQ350_003368 [Teloschistes chrysophthalmus]|nr:MAG: hypothetical protein LQ350_003368 [Niorma chrysophthalma]
MPTPTTLPPFPKLAQQRTPEQYAAFQRHNLQQRYYTQAYQSFLKRLEEQYRSLQAVPLEKLAEAPQRAVIPSKNVVAPNMQGQQQAMVTAAATQARGPV